MKKRLLPLLIASLLLSGCNSTEPTQVDTNTNVPTESGPVIKPVENNEGNNENTDNGGKTNDDNGNTNNNDDNVNTNNDDNGGTGNNNNDDNKETLKEMTFAEAYAACNALANNAETSYDVKLTATINTTPNKGTSGNWSFNVNDGTASANFIKVYYLESADGESPANGDTVEITGKLKNYVDSNNKHTFEFVSGTYKITQRGEIGSNTGNSGENTGHTSGGDAEKYDIKDVIPTNKAIDISSGVNYSWKDKSNNVDYDNAPEWDFYYGTSFEPDGQRWGNGRDDGGIEFERNCYMVSPMFETNKKIEVRFTFHLVKHTSSKFNPYTDKPVFFFREYDKDGNLLEDPKLKQPYFVESNKVDKLSDDEKENMTIISKIPNDSTWTLTTYLDNDDCAFFVLSFNNYLPYGSQGGYTCVLNSAYLKSWQYDVK